MNQDNIANPAPLGLLSFGMTTVLLNLVNSGIVPELNSTVLAMGIAVGGLAQIIAGIMEFKKNNTFGATAFCAYGLFWWSLVLIWILPGWTTGIAPASEFAMGFYLSLWCLFTLAMAIGTLKHNKASQVVFFSLTLLFALLAIADFSANHTIKMAAGYVGIACGLSALYNAFGQIINGEFKKQILPLG